MVLADPGSPPGQGSRPAKLRPCEKRRGLGPEGDRLPNKAHEAFATAHMYIYTYTYPYVYAYIYIYVYTYIGIKFGSIRSLPPWTSRQIATCTVPSMAFRISPWVRGSSGWLRLTSAVSVETLACPLPQTFDLSSSRGFHEQGAPR